MMAGMAPGDSFCDSEKIAFSPAASVLTTADSIPPVPEQVSVITGWLVWKTYLRSSVTSARIAFASGERW